MPPTEIDETTALPSEASDATWLLIRARGFVERGWCRDALARDADGKEVDPKSERAVAWCMFGALRMAGMPCLPFARSYPAFRFLEAAIGGERMPHFNDRQETVDPVLAAFDRAIAAG